MPHVLWELQGTQRLVHLEKTGSVYYNPNYKNSLDLVTTGKQTEKEYDRTVRDLVNYLVYIGEPIKLKQKLGFGLCFICLFFL
jgi:ubiquinol-cytochrome c reductase cytochrome c1 subunit